MSWFNTLIDAANLAANLNQYQKLSSMTTLQEQAVLASQLQAVIKEYMFQVNQALKSLLAHAQTEPLPVAVGLYLLEADFNASGIDTSMFLEFSDKEIFASIRQQLESRKAEILKNLVPDLQNKFSLALKALESINDLRYIFVNYKNVILLQEAKEELAALRSNKPALLAFAAQSQWNKSYRVANATIDRLAPNIDLEQFFKVCFKHYKTSSSAIGTLRDYQERLEYYESFFQEIFKTCRLPDMIDPLKNQENTSLEFTTSFEKEASLPQGKCPNCGYQNSKSRSSCKNCRILLPKP